MRAKEEEKNRETTEGRAKQRRTKRSRGKTAKCGMERREERRCAAAKCVLIVAEENGE
jgi:hypothetical protein